MGYDLVLRDRALHVSEGFDYENVDGDTFYYADTEGVSDTVNIGSIAVGEALVRRSPSWVKSAGTSYLRQRQAFDTDDVEVEPPHVVGATGEPDFAVLPPLETTADGEAVHEVGAGGEPAYQNTWTGTTTFYLTNLGRVRVEMDVDVDPASDAVVFTLPTGYRPAAPYDQGDVTVGTNGAVTPNGAVASLDLTGDGAFYFDVPGAEVADDIPILIQGSPPLSFYKDPFGIVHLQGRSSWADVASTTAADLFTLPPGYRPEGDTPISAGTWDFDSDTSGLFGDSAAVIFIEASGVVSIRGASATDTGVGDTDMGPVMDGLTFRAAA